MLAISRSMRATLAEMPTAVWSSFAQKWSRTCEEGGEGRPRVSRARARRWGAACRRSWAAGPERWGRRAGAAGGSLASAITLVKQ